MTTSAQPLEPTFRIGSGLSGHHETVKAAEQACERSMRAFASDASFSGNTDLVLLFCSQHHVDRLEHVIDVVQRTLRPGCILGVTAEGVIGGGLELERSPGISILSMRLPGVEIAPFTADQIFPVEDNDAGLDRLGAIMGFSDTARATFLFVDPFSVPLIRLLPAMNQARRRVGGPGPNVGPIIGGLASGAASAGGSAIMLNSSVMRKGFAGITLRGPLKVDTVVSQGCRAFGPNMVVTKSKANLIMQLGGKPAINAVREVVEELPERDRELLRKGLFVGRVINEYKERFGRDDFLIREVLGADETSGSLAVADQLRIGQTIRLHLRDANTAEEDLALLLDAQQLHEPPAGGLLITCNGRGTRLFDRPHHDASAVTKAFLPPAPGEERAGLGGGREIDPESPAMPLAGFFAGGEIGPVGDESFLHGHTACLALFRKPQ